LLTSDKLVSWHSSIAHQWQTSQLAQLYWSPVTMVMWRS